MATEQPIRRYRGPSRFWAKLDQVTLVHEAMSSPFSRSIRSLQADGFRRSLLVLLLAAALLGAWLAWFLLARLPRYEVTDQGRLEVDQAGHPVQARVAGRVTAARLSLGQEVRAGEVLVELETDAQRLQLAEERTRLAALGPQMAALRDEIAAQEQARREEQAVSRVVLEAARAQSREAEALSRLADEEAERMERLRGEGILSEADFRRGRAEAQRRRAAAESLDLAAGKVEPEQRVREHDREARLKQLKAELTRLEGQQTTAAATIQRLEYEIERRRIQAPVDGRLGEVAVLRAGAFVGEGEKLGVVLPSGNLRVIAEFPPPAALGRVRPGQPATLRLHGFPWTQYGTISATVSSVAGEIRDGRVRVELDVHPNPGSVIPFQHGLPGTVEIQVERVSPATLVLRAAGRLITTPRSWFEPAGGPGG